MLVDALSNFSDQVKFDGSPETHPWHVNTLEFLAFWHCWFRFCEASLPEARSEATLWTAWLSLLVFTVLGAVIGWLAERIVRESVSGQILSELQDKTAQRLPRRRP